MRTWMKLVPAILLVLPLTPALLRAADTELPVKKEDVAELSKKIDKLLEKITTNSVRDASTATELREIRVELQRIRELLEIMARQQGAIQQQSMYGPTPAPQPAAAPTTGTITVQSTHPSAATVVINGQPYPIEPFSTRTIILPAGSFQYSVDVAGFGPVGSLRSETLRAGGGYRINIFPQ